MISGEESSTLILFEEIIRQMHVHFLDTGFVTYVEVPSPVSGFAPSFKGKGTVTQTPLRC